MREKKMYEGVNRALKRNEKLVHRYTTNGMNNML